MKEKGAILLALCTTILACGDDSITNTTPPDDCGASLVFSVLPVPMSAIVSIAPVGNMGPPWHTVPTDHSGFLLVEQGLTLSAPGPLRVTSISRLRYLASPFRQGFSDFAITANACNGYKLIFGHIQTVVDKIASQTGDLCNTCSTANETVEACRNESADISFAADETIGTVGLSTTGAQQRPIRPRGRSPARPRRSFGKPRERLSTAGPV